jgi:hypothetical protein
MALAFTAFAMPGAADTQSEKKRLEQLAVDAYEKGDYARAAELYAGIARLVPGPIPHHNRGLALERAGERARARAAYVEALALAEGDDAMRARLTARIDALRPHLGRLRVEAPKGEEITVNDAPAQKVPIDVFVEPGAVRLVLAPRRGKRVVRNVEVGAGETLVVDLQVPPPSPRPKPRRQSHQDATLDVRMPIGATLLGLAGAGAAAAIALNVRTHDLFEAYCPTYESEGQCYGTWEQRDATIDYRNATFAVAGVAGALAVTGIALLIASAVDAPQSADGLALRF